MIMKKLGVINNIEFKLNELTVFTGNNNSGKTYTSYLLYGILSALSENQFFKIIELKELENFLKNNGKIRIDKDKVEVEYIRQSIEFINNHFIDIVVKNFKIDTREFENFELEIKEEDIKSLLGDFCAKESNIWSINKIKFNIQLENNYYVISKIDDCHENIIDILSDKVFMNIIASRLSNLLLNIPKTVYFPAERIGINVFRNELNENRLKTYDTIINNLQYTNLKSKKEKNKMKNELIFINSLLSNIYPKPVSDYIKFLNSIKPDYGIQQTSEISKYIQNNILNGKYEINEKDNTVSFRQRIGQKKYKSLPFHIASASIKSLYGIDYYLDEIGKVGDFLIIDEPELSLHPENQIKLAIAISMIVDMGIKVVLSTHSDLFIRSLVNIILKNKIKNKKENKKLLLDEDIYIYNFSDKQVKRCDNVSEISYFENFDDSVIKLQNEYNDLNEELEQL